MKNTFKKSLSLILTLILVVSLSMTAFAAEITEEKVKEIALSDAGYGLKDAIHIRAWQDYDDGIKQWEVNFLVQNAEGYYIEYDYEISAADGRIIDKERDFEDDYNTKTTKKAETNERKQTTKPNSKTEASGRANFETTTAVTTTKAAAEPETTQAKDEPAASKVSESPVAQADFDIGEEAAKTAAAESFGFNVEDIRFLEARKTFDDGVPVYDIEFRQGFKAKYSCEVIAATGDVTDKDVDIPDSFGDKLELFGEAALAWFVSLFK